LGSHIFPQGEEGLPGPWVQLVADVVKGRELRVESWGLRVCGFEPFLYCGEESEAEAEAELGDGEGGCGGLMVGGHAGGEILEMEEGIAFFFQPPAGVNIAIMRIDILRVQHEGILYFVSDRLARAEAGWLRLKSVFPVDFYLVYI